MIDSGRFALRGPTHLSPQAGWRCSHPSRTSHRAQTPCVLEPIVCTATCLVGCFGVMSTARIPSIIIITSNLLGGRTSHTNLTRRIDPRHPEPPTSTISPKRPFSFFRFLGLGGEGVRFLGFRGGGGTQSGVWPAAGGMHRPGLGECTEAGPTTRSLKTPSKNPSRQA